MSWEKTRENEYNDERTCIMKVKVTRRYIADDGMEFSSKKAAAYHEADTFAQELGYTTEEYERIYRDMWIAHGHTNIRSYDWHDLYREFEYTWKGYMRDIVHEHDDLQHKRFLVYEYGDATNVMGRPLNLVAEEVIDVLSIILNLRNHDYYGTKEILERLMVPRIEREYTDDKHECHYFTKDNDAKRLREQNPDAMIFLRTCKPLTIREKLARHMTLSMNEIREFKNENDVVYEEHGEPLPEGLMYVSTVVDDGTGKLWCIDWLKGLTDPQPDVYDTRPYRVHLKRTQGSTTVTEIVKGA